MASQTGKNIVIAYKVEATFNTAPGASGAKQLRLNSSPGLSLKRANIRSNEVRSDGLSTIPRLGSYSVDGTYNSELSVGTFDEILEAVTRSTWVAAVAITQATMTSITTTTNTIVAAAGSWLTQGVRVGDVVRLTGHATAANNNLNLRVKTVTASTITVHGTPLTTDAVADTSFTLTVLKKLKNATTPTKRSFYIDEYNADIDMSESFGGCKFTGFKITGSPDGMAMIEFTILGASETEQTTGNSPYFTSPTQYTSIPLVFTDAVISLGGSDIATLTAFEFSAQITAATLPVIGGNTTPDVFDNDCRVTGSISGLRTDLTNVTRFKNETELALHVLLTEPEADPKDCIAIYVPRLKFLSADSPLGNDGAMIETMPWEAGVLTATSSEDQTMYTISTSAA